MEPTEQQVRDWLNGYARIDPAELDCIIAQGDWRYIDAVADKYAGAQEEPGPKAFAEGEGFALSALYECHDGPHLPTCPHAKK